MFDKVKSIAERTVYSVKTFREEPVNNLAYLLITAMVLTSIISGIVSCIMFAIQGGYLQQIELLKNDGLDGISVGFTNGTVGMITSGITSKIMCGLVFAEFVVMMISYFKNSSRVKRRIMIVDLAFCLIVIVLATVVFWITVGELVITEQDVYKYFSVFEGMTINLRVILITYLVVAVISLTAYLVLILTTKECRWVVGYTALALLFSNIAVPLFFLVLENIIPLMTGAIALAIIGVLIFGVFKFFLSGSDSAGTSSINSKVSYIMQSENKSETKSVPRDNNQREIKDWSGPFWRDKGGLGILTPQADCIYVKNAWGEKTYVCTVTDFEKGTKAIIDCKTKCRVMQIAGCKMPER